MVDFEIDPYDITVRFIVPGMIILAILGVIIYQMGDENVFGAIGKLIGGGGLKMP